MKVLVLGKNGQLAKALAASVPADIDLICWGRDELDLSVTDAIAPAITELAPEVIINASAYTAVDKAESDTVAAQALNVDAVATVSSLAATAGIFFVHVSTDFVFDGAASRPYRTTDNCRPLGVYGDTKRQGELAILASGARVAIVRTAWVYRSGSANFMSTMLRLMAERDELGVVCDQVGTPTSADNLADVLWRIVEKNLAGLWHYTDAGVASWYDFACAIHKQSRQLSLLEREITITPLLTSEYPTPAKRPAYSVLDCSLIRQSLGLSAIHWQDALEKQLLKLAKG